MLEMLGPIVSAGANLLGGFLGRSAQEQQRAQNEALQREFAQNSIQWRVADAKKAGIHPMYAMGAPTISPAVSVQADPLAASIGSMGQNITRAMAATAPVNEREEMYRRTMQEMQLQRITLQNDLLASQITRLKSAQVGPGGVRGGSDEGDFAVSVQRGKLDDRTRVVAGGQEIATDPGTSDTQQFTNRYGEFLGDFVFGPYVAWRDFNRHVLVPASDSFEARRARWHGVKHGGDSGRR